MKMTKTQKKIGKVMGEYKEGTLHSGKGGKVVKNPKQAIAIAISERQRQSALVSKEYQDHQLRKVSPRLIRQEESHSKLDTQPISLKAR